MVAVVPAEIDLELLVVEEIEVLEHLELAQIDRKTADCVVVEDHFVDKDIVEEDIDWLAVVRIAAVDKQDLEVVVEHKVAVGFVLVELVVQKPALQVLLLPIIMLYEKRSYKI